MDRRQRRLLVRLALAAAVATLIVVRYTSPKSIFQPVPLGNPPSNSSPSVESPQPVVLQGPVLPRPEATPVSVGNQAKPQ